MYGKSYTVHLFSGGGLVYVRLSVDLSTKTAPQAHHYLTMLNTSNSVLLNNEKLGVHWEQG